MTVALTGLTNHTVLVGAGTATITKVGPGSAGQILQSGGASADPAYSTATYPSTAGTSGTHLTSNGTNFVNTTATYPSASGGTGKILYDNGTNFIESTPTFPASASATTRKIIVSDGTNWVASTETYAVPGTSGNVMTSDGTNWTSATPASGAITWSVITADQAAAVNKGYFCNKAGLLTLTLPTTSAVGDTIAVSNINTALGWAITYTTNQQIFFGNTSSTITTGSLASAALGDTVTIVCRTANLTWQVINSVGNITVV